MLGIEVITQKFADIYRQDMASLGVGLPDIEPHATDHIDEIIQMIDAFDRTGLCL